MKTEAFVDTTVLTDFLLKPGTPKNLRARAALQRYSKTLLPVYAIKEWKDGPLGNYAYLHDKLAFTQSWARTMQVVSALPSGYKKLTAMDAVSAAATKLKSQPYTGLGKTDRDMADCYRYALYSIIKRSWKKRRKVATETIHDLLCYEEVAPSLSKDGMMNLAPRKCRGEGECNFAGELRANQKLLQAMRDAIPVDSGRSEDTRRRNALKQIIKHPATRIDRDTCRDLGDAIFAFCCPTSAAILTTNAKDHGPLAVAIGKTVETP